MSSLRLPQSLVRRLGDDSGEAVLRYELLEEQASALGRGGRKVAATLQTLRDHDAVGLGQGEARAALVKAAADAVWGFLVQREIAGFRDRDRVVAEYAIPREVMARLGAR